MVAASFWSKHHVFTVWYLKFLCFRRKQMFSGVMISDSIYSLWTHSVPTVYNSFSKTLCLIRDISCLTYVSAEILYLDFSYLRNQTADLDFK